MVQFQILDALKVKATANGWAFVIGTNSFIRNYELNREFFKGQKVLVADSTFKPKYKNSRIMGIEYSCFLSLGLKFDIDGQAADLDETDAQKYERRLGNLVADISDFIAEFGCENELTIIDPTLNFDINMFDENLDFVTSNNTIFNQLGQ